MEGVKPYVNRLKDKGPCECAAVSCAEYGTFRKDRRCVKTCSDCTPCRNDKGGLTRTPFAQKPTKEQPGWVKAVRAVKLRSGGLCEIQTPVCTKVGTSTHHRLRRGQGGNAETEADIGMLARVCLPCDQFLMSHVSEAYERGWLIRGHEGRARRDQA